MSFRKVVITGLGAISPLGNSVGELISGLEGQKSAVECIAEWENYKGMRSMVAAPVRLENEKLIPRHNRRSMGRLSIFATQAAQEAIKDALLSSEDLTSGKLGCIISSTMGSAESIAEAFEIMGPGKDLSLLPSTKFFQCISHSAAMNVAQYLGITGVVMAPCSACASALQSIGLGYDLIRLGRQDLTICGGAEGLHPSVVGSFDILYATSSNYNNTPKNTPRPFDVKRDGLVCGEGSGILVLEEYEHARKRGAKIYAEIIGYNTCGNGDHVSESNRDAIISCIRQSIASSGISAQDIDYINAHATATIQGDKEEAFAIREIFGGDTPVSSLKGYMGHTLGASGAIELIASLIMMQKSRIYPTLNLQEPDKDCQGINHVMKLMDKSINILLKNCFAFGGINATLICKKCLA